MDIVILAVDFHKLRLVFIKRPMTRLDGTMELKSVKMLYAQANSYGIIAKK